MKDYMQIEHLCGIIADLRKDVETLQKLRKEDAATLKRWQEDARFGQRCRLCVQAMAEYRDRGAPGFIDMCAPILIQMLNLVAPPKDSDAKEVNP